MSIETSACAVEDQESLDLIDKSHPIGLKFFRSETSISKKAFRPVCSVDRDEQKTTAVSITVSKSYSCFVLNSSTSIFPSIGGFPIEIKIQIS